MKYTLITPKGKVMPFYIKETAECYRLIHGGVIVTYSILTEKVAYSNG